ncbi:hypothetical protein CBL_20669 [Carabus blaptoides fortunei]
MQERKIKLDDEEWRIVTVYSDGNLKNITEELNEKMIEMDERNLNIVIQCDGVEEQIEEIVQEIEKAIPKKETRRKSKNVGCNNWWDSECRAKKRTLAKTFRDWRRGTGSQEVYNKTRREYKAKGTDTRQ